MKELTQKRNKKILPIFRASIQVLCFLLIPSAFISIFQSMKSVFYAVVHQSGMSGSLLLDILLLVVVTVITGVVGRFFCGWVCAFGSMGDFIYAISKRIRKKVVPVPKMLDFILKGIKYVLLSGIVVFVWGFQLVQIPSGSNPWDLFGMFLTFGSWPSVSTLTSGWVLATIILSAIFAGSFLVERFFCRYLCPLGAYFSLISRLRANTILKKRENCGACSLCTKKCSMGINLSKKDEVHSGECIHCMECVTNCPAQNATMTLVGCDTTAILAGSATAAMIGGAVYLGTYFNSNLSNTTLSSNTTSVEGELLAATSSNLEDGTYEGTGDGFRGELTVEITITEGILSEIEIIDSNDDESYLNRVKNQMIPLMLAAQSSTVDAVSGATYSSNGLIEAVQNALNNAQGGSITLLEEETTADLEEETIEKSNETTETQTESETATLGSVCEIADGVYQGTGTGFRGDTNVSVTVENGNITSISIDSYQDDQRFFEQAVDTVIEEIISNQEATVDAVSGATYSSNGIMDAVADALGLEYTQIEVPSGHGGHHGR